MSLLLFFFKYFFRKRDQDLVLHRFGGAGTRLVGEPGKNVEKSRTSSKITEIQSHVLTNRLKLGDVGGNRIQAGKIGFGMEKNTWISMETTGQQCVQIDWTAGGLSVD